MKTQMSVMNSEEMRKSRLSLGMTAVVLFVILSAQTSFASVADRSTFQQWSFSTWNYGPVQPDDGWNNPFGTPELVVSTSSNWNSSVGQHSGVWTLNGEMDFIIPNYPDTTRPEKDISVVVMWKGAGLSNFVPDKPLLGIECDYDSVVISRQETPLTDGWKSTLFTLNVFPNPSEEWIVIKGDIIVDSVTIDTICIPEPATLGLLIGGAFIAFKRSRNKYGKKQISETDGDTIL